MENGVASKTMCYEINHFDLDQFYKRSSGILWFHAMGHHPKYYCTTMHIFPVSFNSSLV